MCGPGAYRCQRGRPNAASRNAACLLSVGGWFGLGRWCTMSEGFAPVYPPLCTRHCVLATVYSSLCTRHHVLVIIPASPCALCCTQWLLGLAAGDASKSRSLLSRTKITKRRSGNKRRRAGRLACLDQLRPFPPPSWHRDWLVQQTPHLQ